MTDAERLDAAIGIAAKLAYDANGYYRALFTNDPPQQEWHSARAHVRESIMDGARKVLTGVILSPVGLHVSWTARKEEDGWKYGQKLDYGNKTHPCMVPFDDLPEEHQVKDVLFLEICFAVKRAILGVGNPDSK